jgi:hypothetical protein
VLTDHPDELSTSTFLSSEVPTREEYSIHSLIQQRRTGDKVVNKKDEIPTIQYSGREDREKGNK